jgi:hypothetical protein
VFRRVEVEAKEMKKTLWKKPATPLFLFSLISSCAAVALRASLQRDAQYSDSIVSLLAPDITEPVMDVIPLVA